jgi:hypothetical protein
MGGVEAYGNFALRHKKREEFELLSFDFLMNVLLGLSDLLRLSCEHLDLDVDTSWKAEVLESVDRLGV